MGAMKIDNSPARGMRDLLPADVAVRDHVLESIAAVYRRFGYQRIETPALEHIDRLSSGEGGDNEKLIFEVLRRGLPPEVAADWVPGVRYVVAPAAMCVLLAFELGALAMARRGSVPPAVPRAAREREPSARSE